MIHRGAPLLKKYIKQKNVKMQLDNSTTTTRKTCVLTLTYIVDEPLVDDGGAGVEALQQVLPLLLLP